MENSNDPWEWMKKQQQQSAPLAPSLIPISAPTAEMQGVQQQPGPLGTITNLATAKAATEAGKLGEKVYDAYNKFQAPLAAANPEFVASAAPGTIGAVPAVTAPLAPLAAPAVELATVSAPAEAAAATGLAASAGLAAPAIAEAAPALLGSGALGAGAGALTAALASNPIGWGIGAALLAKKLKLF